jgi:hypothetical protein
VSPRPFAGAVSCIALLLIAFGAASARPSGQAPAPAGSDPADSGPLVAAGPAPDFVLLYTGNVVGYVEPCG